ncbi:hypothetical protein FOZ61_010316 [Perkinsus olseni]|uniref:Uncharacterized protein n=1 Tax=Perkinsus olseni TaxID=32597 RepID=A0A7J6KXM6_PEROL|nr:hypothetical protein FOZ61_010316 [Perkinsus olseni]KAF4672155.1 hypothetical protein FOL46_009388 [Perkinsus olseni]
MPNFSLKLVITQALVIVTTAQDVGKFVHETADYRITYDVDENHEATFTFWVPSPPGRWSPDGTSNSSSVVRQPPEEFTHGAYPLSKTDTFTYAIDFDGSRASAHAWYKSIERLLLRNNVIDYDDSELYGGIQSGDLTVLTYTSGDSFSTSFRDEEIRFMRVGGSLTPGEYVFKEKAAPYLEVDYRIRSNGYGDMMVKCKRRRTSRLSFKLSHRTKGLQYDHYAVEPASGGTLYQFLHQVRAVCPTIRLDTDDLSKVIFATERTIFVILGRARLALTSRE